MKTTENHNEQNLNVEGFSQAELKRNVFKTPEGYFENLTPRVMESVRTAEKSEISIAFEWKRMFIPSLSVAAIVLTALFFINPADTTKNDLDTVLASITIEELTEYADFDAAELVSYDLVDYNQIALSQTQLSEEDIIDYLSENEIELNTIIDEIEI